MYTYKIFMINITNGTCELQFTGEEFKSRDAANEWLRSANNYGYDGAQLIILEIFHP